MTDSEKRSSSDATSAPEADTIRGPHLWLNWQGMLAGQPARPSSHGEFIVVSPAWEEWALYSDAETLVLRSDDHRLEAPLGVFGEVPDVRGWTQGDLGDQMAEVLSLALGRRLRSGGVVRQGFERWP